MHLTFVILVDIALFWVTPFLACWWFFGRVAAIWIGLPCLVGLSSAYAILWRPQQWLWIRDHRLARTWVYPNPVQAHGPNAAFDPTKSPKQKYIIGVHCHGPYPIAIVKHFVLNPKFYQARGCVHWILTTVPILKELSCWAGAIDATRSSMMSALGREDIQGLITTPGGVHEGLIDIGKIVPRTGFIQIAVEHGAVLIPVYDSTANDTYDVTLLLGTYFYTRLRYPWPVALYGHNGYFGPHPKRITGHLWIGEAIATKGKDLQEIHREFYKAIDDLKQLADDFKVTQTPKKNKS